jgi:hypothetical protein
MDYNIKFKYEGMGKQAIQARKQAIQATQTMEQKQGNKIPLEQLNILKKMTKQFDSMIFILKSISSGMGAGTGGGGGGGHGGAGYPSPGGGGGFGSKFKGFAGAAAIGGVIGYAIHKVNEIGSAYIEKASEQAKSVGYVGFRRGQGMYTGAEVGAGMKEYAKATGRFQNVTKPDKTAMSVGAMYGLSAEETLGVAGHFTRGGANYGKSAQQGAGMGIQTDLPILLKSMGDTFEESVRDGVDTSQMGKDMAATMAQITLKTPGRDIGAVTNMIKQFDGVKSNLERGKMAGFEEMYAFRATKQSLMSKLTDTGEEGLAFREKLLKEGHIDEKGFAAISKLGKGSSYEDLQRGLGPLGAEYLRKKETGETDPVTLMRETQRIRMDEYGKGTRGLYAETSLNDSLGGSQKQWQIKAVRDAIKEGKPIDVTKKGEEVISKGEKAVSEGPSGIAMQKILMHENLLLNYGLSFANAAMKMEKSLMNMAEKAAPGAIKALNGLSNVADKVSDGLTRASKNFKTNFVLFKYFED